MVVASKIFKLIVTYFLSVETINHQFAILLIAYASVLSHIGGMAVTEILMDLHDNETEFIDNYTDINVEGVSNAVLWSCRKGGKMKKFL